MSSSDRTNAVAVVPPQTTAVQGALDGQLAANPYEGVQNGQYMADLYTVLLTLLTADWAVKDVQRLAPLADPKLVNLKTAVVALGRQLIDARQLMISLFTAVANFTDRLKPTSTTSLPGELRYRASLKPEKQRALTTQQGRDKVQIVKVEAALKALANLQLQAVALAKQHLEQMTDAAGREALRAKLLQSDALAQAVAAAERKFRTARNAVFEAKAPIPALFGRIAASNSIIETGQQDAQAAAAAARSLGDEEKRYREKAAEAPERHSTTRFLFWTISSHYNTQFDQAKEIERLATQRRIEEENKGRTAAERVQAAQLEKKQAEEEIERLRPRIEELKKDQANAEKELTTAKKTFSDAMAAIDAVCESFGGGPVSHVIRVMAAISDMLVANGGYQNLQRFVELMQNRLGQFDDVLVRLDDHDSVADQMQLMMPQIMEQIDGQDHLAPFTYMAQELAPKIDGLIKAAELPAQQLDQYRQRYLPAGALNVDNPAAGFLAIQELTD